MTKHRRVVEEWDSSSEEDDSEEEVEDQRRGGSYLRQGQPLSAVSGPSSQPGVPPIMGGSMAATSSPRGEEQRKVPKIPNTAVIRGPERTLPQPFDGRDKQMGHVQASYGPTNERPRPMENVPYRQTPVLPFSGRRDTSAFDTGRSPFELFQATGFDQDSWRPKREQGPMFTPQPQNIYGMPAPSEVSRDRYQPSNELRHQKPFEPEWSLRDGHFHPTKRILPTHTPVLRQQLSSNYVAGPSKATSHPSGLFGESRGELGMTQRKGNDLSFYFRVPFPTSVVNPASTQRAPIVDRPTDRQVNSRPYGGGANASATGAGAAQMRGKYRTIFQRLPSAIRERIGAGGVSAQTGGAGQTRFADKARTTRAEFTELSPGAGATTQIRVPVAAGFAPPMDVARTTRAEISELAVAPQMYNQVGPGAPTAHFMDQARATVSELTEGQVVVHNAYGGAAAGGAAYTGPMDVARPTISEFTELAGETATGPLGHGGLTAAQMYNMDPARTTLKQWTSDHEYTGGVGHGQLQAVMNRDQYANVNLNDKLEQTNTVSRAPTMGPLGTVSTNADRVGFGDPNTVRVRSDVSLGDYYQAPGSMPSQGLDPRGPLAGVMTTNDNLTMIEQTVDSRNSPYVLGQLQSNPYAIPMFAQTGNMNLPLEVSGANPVT